MARREIKNNIYTVKSVRPYKAGSMFDGKIGTEMCILRLAFNYLEDYNMNVAEVLEACKEKVDMKSVYAISDKERFVYPRLDINKGWKYWLEKLYWDLKEIGRHNLARFIYDYNHF